MSQVRSGVEVVSKTEREEVARRVSDAFNRLSPEEKRRFTDETLTVLVNMPKKKMGKLLGKFFKRGRPSTKDLETINQLVVIFLYSIKNEFLYHYASMVFKGLQLPLPVNLPEKLLQVRQKVFLSDIGVSPDVYKRLYEAWKGMGNPDYDKFFSSLLSGQSKSG